MNLNEEKLKIIALPGNVLVTANPGTGKTLLLAGKYVDLIKKGVAPDDILCLTFTNKARREMEERIIKFIKEENLQVDLSKLNVYTFHSYALDNIDDSDLVSTNLLRYAVFRYLKDHDTLNYSESYLIDTIVPKMENLIRYLKTFGVTPDMINAAEAKKLLVDDKNFTKEELAGFLDEFIKIFEYYERIKHGHGIDYADMLITFLKLKNPRKYKYVLVDELQDVNGMEAEIALKSGETFFVVGDQKQAIFGFQGGSIINFKKFKDANKSILSENFRSTNEVLSYARDFFSSKTKEESHKTELKGLKNKEKSKGEKPMVYDCPKENQAKAACVLAQKLSEKCQVAIIARTNIQIMKISKELKARDIDHSTTYFSASVEAKENIITFLKGVLSNDVQLVKNAMFTPFFPISLQEAFDLNNKRNVTLEELYAGCPDFKKLREEVKTVEDLNLLFKDKILPVAISYGEEYLLAAISVQEACAEAIKLLEDKTINNFSIYLESSDMLANESDVEKKIVVTTVHKAKGKEFDTVIYVPSKTSDRSNFQDRVVEAILKSKGINAKEELEEESLRVDFVAFTRAKEKLIILTDKPSEYISNVSEFQCLKTTEAETVDLSDLKKRAYNLFINKKYDEAKQLLERKNSWLRSFVANHFQSLEHISFSRLKEKAYDYLKESILRVQEPSEALDLGSEVHEVAEKLCLNQECSCSEKAQPYIENVKKLIKEIKAKYPEVDCVEESYNIPLSKIIGTSDSINFNGKIDVVFKNKDEYLIVDWKTSGSEDGSSEYRQQLSVYQRIYAIHKKVPLEKVKVAIGYCGLRKKINDGIIRLNLDDKQPAGTAFGTITRKLEKFLVWKADVDVFFNDLIDEEADDVLWRSLIEQYSKEKGVKRKRRKE